MPNSIREMIQERQSEIARGNLLPGRAAELLTELAALLGNVNSEIVDRDIAYNKKLLACYEQEEKANRAKILAEVSQEYRDKMEARNTKELCVELIRSLKFFLRAAEEEFKTQKFA